MIIYKTTNLINGKIYVGKDKKENPSYYGSGIVFRQAIKKYGKENFKKEILERCDTFEVLNEKEIFWIDKLQACNKQIGYNRSLGGDGFSGMLPETIETIRLKNTGQKRTKETKHLQSVALKDKPKSEEHKKSLSKAWVKRKIEKPHTQKTKDQMSKSMIGKNVGKYIKIYQFKGPDGKIYQTNEGLVKFAKSINKHPISFRNLIQGKTQEYKGWTYLQTIKD